MIQKLFYVLLGIIALVSAALADDPVRPVEVNLSIRSFGAGEGNYVSGTVTLPAISRNDLYVQMVQSPRRSFTAGTKVGMTGGDDFEVGVSNLETPLPGSLSVGVGFPSTSAASNPCLTYGYKYAVSESLELTVKGYTGDTGATGAFAKYKKSLGGKGEVSLEVGGLFTGQSTFDSSNGMAKRELLVNAQYRYRISDSRSVSIGLTNTLGDSTRFSLNSSVGNNYALFVGFGGKF